MKHFEFQVACLDRVELRQPGTKAMNALNALGAEGWHIVHIREDRQHERDLLIFLEREIGT